MIEIQGVTKKFRKKTVLDDITQEFNEGVYGLLGPNGAGKTTLMRCMTGLLECSSGDILCDGTPTKKSKDFISRVGYLPQKFGLFKELTVREMMLMLANMKECAGKKAMEEVERCVDMVNLSDRIDSRVRALSGGMIRRLGIAQTFLGDPDIMIFDEPTAGLDPEERLRFKLLISENKKGKTVIISTHIVSDIEALCDHVLVMNDGCIAAAGSCEEIRRKAEGKVYTVDGKDIESLSGEYVIQDQTDGENGVKMRILSTVPQTCEAAIPTLEDGYMCVLKNI